jgi:hypothetical protein
VPHIAPDARGAASEEGRDDPDFDQGVVGKGRELFENAPNTPRNIFVFFGARMFTD